MFASLFEAIITPGKKAQVYTVLIEELLPFARRQDGFVDAMVLTSDVNPYLGITLTLWETKHDADMCVAASEYKSALDRIRPSVEMITVRTFTVDLSTVHTIRVSAAD